MTPGLTALASAIGSFVGFIAGWSLGVCAYGWWREICEPRRIAMITRAPFPMVPDESAASKRVAAVTVQLDEKDPSSRC
jgi:hypothetical protein